MRHKTWLQSQEGPWNEIESSNENDAWEQELASIPTWYRQAPYHAYQDGHLSWEAALEIELAGAAIGARNMPTAGRDGETTFRNAFTDALLAAGASVWSTNEPSKVVTILDVGCGTGTSTRRLARQFPQPHVRLVGIDLSPYYVRTARRLLELAPTTETNAEQLWVCNITLDHRISYQWGNFGDELTATGTAFTTSRSTKETEMWTAQPNSVDVVNIQFVWHEVPLPVALAMIRQAHGVLKSGGQLWVCEMDFQAPAYRAQRSNPLLYSLLRATEPYLDDYAQGQDAIWSCLRDTFATVTIVPATGRHYSCVAVKGHTVDDQMDKPVSAWNDLRFDDDGNYRVPDTHLKLWEDKQQ
jgi:ubiquinone/menaquinone biosynthesis C-methylase UbiE